MYARWPASSRSPSSEEMSSATCGREEARQLGPLALDGVEQPRVRDRDGRLVGERRDELDLPVGEQPRGAPADADDADERVVQEDRNTEQRPIADERCAPNE